MPPSVKQTSHWTWWPFIRIWTGLLVVRPVACCVRPDLKRTLLLEAGWCFKVYAMRSTVGFFSMDDAINYHASALVINGLDDSIATDTEPIGIGMTFELFCMKSPWITREGSNHMTDTGKHIGWKMTQLTSRGGSIENVIHDWVVSAKRGPSPLGSACRVCEL